LLEIRKCYVKWAHSASNRAPSDLLEAEVYQTLGAGIFA